MSISHHFIVFYDQFIFLIYNGNIMTLWTYDTSPYVADLFGALSLSIY